MQEKAVNKKKKKGTLTTVILVLIMLAGLAIIAYPTFSDWWNSFHQSRAIASYVQSVTNMDKEEYERMLAEADAYNRKLLTKSNRYIFTEAEEAEYNAVMDVTGTGIMGYVEIPKINVSLPIYHGIDEAVLQVAIGHIEGTSIPVGGKGTHAVISGHRGLPSARLFTDIDQLNYGDTFLLQILDRTLTYEVDQIRIVLPSEMQDLEIDPDEDYVTLVTCTPYGINTHRLLVRGRRTENEAEQANVTADALQLEPLIVAPLVAAPILLILLVMLLFATGRRAKERRAIQREVDKMIGRDPEAEESLRTLREVRRKTGKKKTKK